MKNLKKVEIIGKVENSDRIRRKKSLPTFFSFFFSISHFLYFFSIFFLIISSFFFQFSKLFSSLFNFLILSVVCFFLLQAHSSTCRLSLPYFCAPTWATSTAQCNDVVFVQLHWCKVHHAVHHSAARHRPSI